MEETKEQLFIGHLMTVLKEQLKNIYPISGSPNEFESGKSLAYYEVVSLVVESCNIFDLPLKDYGINDVDYEKLI